MALTVRFLSRYSAEVKIKKGALPLRLYMGYVHGIPPVHAISSPQVRLRKTGARKPTEELGGGVKIGRPSFSL